MNYLDLIDSFDDAAAAAATPSSANFEKLADSNHVVVVVLLLGAVVHVAVVSWSGIPIRKEIDSAALP